MQAEDACSGCSGESGSASGTLRWSREFFGESGNVSRTHGELPICNGWGDNVEELGSGRIGLGRAQAQEKVVDPWTFEWLVQKVIKVMW